MLEGQVAILSSGLLSGDESLALLQSLRNSALYRHDQSTYILYPDKTLPGFLSKNTLTKEQVRDLRLPAALADAQDKTLLVRDVEGMYHFSGQHHNAKDVHKALMALASQPQFAEMVAAESDKITALFEDIFHHTEFTGRSGTFFAYEGLGSIYWHMVSKLLLAAQETALRCQNEPASTGLVEKYHDICAGLGFTKPPAVFGAFPTDPYSHTPKGQGARQPGMTGAVKEEIIARQAEVGLVIENGCLIFNALLLDPNELLTEHAMFAYIDVNGKPQQIDVAAGGLVYTVCQVPIVVQLANSPSIKIYLTEGNIQTIQNNRVDHEKIPTQTQFFKVLTHSTRPGNPGHAAGRRAMRLPHGSCVRPAPGAHLAAPDGLARRRAGHRPARRLECVLSGDQAGDLPGDRRHERFQRICPEGVKPFPCQDRSRNDAAIKPHVY
jgi:hypothetical protein